MASQAPPSIPPRPARVSVPAAGSSTNTPAIPPRPVRPAAAAATAAAAGLPTEASENGLPSPSPSPGPTEPEPKTIGSSTELYAPVAVQHRPAPVPKTDSERNAATITASATPISSSKTPSELEGIPQIGRRVPMYPNAGDVQAPTPSATPSGGKKKHVYREEWEMDEGAYGSKRRETPYSMSSVDLNATVAHSSSPGVGVVESEHGVPDEELAYLASDHYAKVLSRSQSRVQSRSQSPVHTRDSARVPSADVMDHGHTTDDEGNVIHVEDPAHGPGYLRRGNSEAVSRAQSHHEDEDEERDHYSILAEDEVLKRQDGQYMQAAVYTPSYTPRHPRSRPASSMGHGDVEGATLELNTRYRSGLESRDSMRTPYEELSPADENAKPLFPDSDEEAEEALKSQLVEKLKRPGMSEQRFPSRDVWEEAPEHAQLEATVQSPPPGDAEPVEDFDQEEMARRKSSEPKQQYVRGQPHEHYEPGDEQEYERKEKEAARKDTDYRLDLKDLPEDERLRRLHKHVGQEDTAPENSSNRRRVERKKFPSNDIWEDVPPSLDLQEEIEPSPIPDKERATTGNISAVVSDPSNSAARPTTSAPIEGSATSTKPIVPSRPSVPARPHREKRLPATIHEQPEPPATHSPTEKKAPPGIPDRPKPSIPARPIGKLTGFVRAQPDEAPEPKPKPPVPPRTGGKIAALKAGLGDLESRLKLGPGAPPKKEKKEDEEPPKEEPLTDVRKSRARGPRGRKLPTKEEKPVVDEPAAKGCEFVGVWTVFTLDQELDAVIVNPVSEEKEKVTEKMEEKEIEAPVSEADAPAVEMDDDHTPATESEPVEKEDKKEDKNEEEKVVAPAVTTTTTLPGVTGTGEQTIAEVEHASGSAKEEEEADKPTAASEGNPTLIPTGEHSEDAAAQSMAEVEPKEPTPTEPEPVPKKDTQLDPEAAAEEGVAERVVKEG
ncbi:hypothetical protein BZA05DRAFT_381418 [Tricharina praecox]|uniref:uncharacterized protein n=1 Tax=Tricharina praecox TaxID=43433 RepID=UPI002220B696|nr:uncharacterized protein BZA05DRAFT_381418 [Tricharina praecox]KAI5858496.1 hypothetical protein BZA05DRAFT_381418 [Tricharina praecox]